MLILYARKLSVLLSVFLILLTANISSGASDELEAYNMLTYYFDLIQSGNYESALGMWEPTARQRATRLGIEYENIPVKPDCNSPILYNFGQVKNILINEGIKSKAMLDSGLIRLQLSLETPKGPIENLYYARKIGSDFWLIFPQDYYAKDWPAYQSRYFRIYVNPAMDNCFNEIALISLDKFVDSIANQIAIPTDRMQVLERQKIDYYLCQNDLEVKQLSGVQTDGVVDPAADAIISSNFPEFHLVARLLINFRLQKLARFSLPLLEQGLSIALGGRWHRAPGVILDFGKYILDYKLTDVDSILLSSSNENGIMSDITFPVEAYLVNYIFISLDKDKFFRLYRVLSGDFNHIKDLKTVDIETAIAESFEISWPEFRNRFEEFVSSDKLYGGQIFPGETKTDRILLDLDGLAISASDKWLQISSAGNNKENPEANLLFNRQTALEGKNSALFKEQYRDTREFEGYRYGIMVDANEIGLYDYALNQLKAKYVFNFTPNPAYFDSAGHKISAFFDIKLLEGNLPGQQDYELIK
jgi:hypothetical protein